MEWLDGPSSETFVDVNAELKQLEGELSEEKARIALGRFMMNNIGFTVRLLTGWILEPWQRIVIKGWLTHNYSLTVASRGLGKSWLISHFCYLYCIFNPNKHVVIVSGAAFKSSRGILERIDGWSRKRPVGKDPGGVLLRQCFDGEMQKRQDWYRIKFTNGSSITALPLGDPERLRSFRCTALVIDEGMLVAQTTIDRVLKPFLFAVSEDETKRRQKIRERERALIKAGKMKKEDEEDFESQLRMITLSSASYQWQDLYTTYKNYLKVINKVEGSEELQEKLGKKAATYLVHQLPYKIGNPDMMDKAAIEDFNSGMYSEEDKKREYEAQFTQGGDGYFSAKKMNECTIPDGEKPTIEIVGEKNAEYVLGIDQNAADTETADHFAMCLLKIVPRVMSDGSVRKIGLVVHQYAEAGSSLNENIEYLYYLMINFNIVYITYDASQGKNAGFDRICNESSLFKEKKIELKHLDADFNNANIDEISKAVRKSYNKQELRIVHPQSFQSADFQRAGNERLQMVFNNRDILFAAKAKSQLDDTFARLVTQDIGDRLQHHAAFKVDIEGGRAFSKYEFVEHQDDLIDLVKKECTLIEQKSSVSGHLTWDIPQHLKRNNKNRNRIRRDSYTALMVANWGLYIYLKSLEIPEEAPRESYLPEFAVKR